MKKLSNTEAELKKALLIKKTCTSSLAELRRINSWILTTNSKSTYFLNIFWRLWDNAAVFLSSLSFSRIVVYVFMEKKYMAKFALVFYGFLVFGNMFTTFFISYQISLLFESILHCLNSFLVSRVFLNSPLTSL